MAGGTRLAWPAAVLLLALVLLQCAGQVDAGRTVTWYATVGNSGSNTRNLHLRVPSSPVPGASWRITNVQADRPCCGDRFKFSFGAVGGDNSFWLATTRTDSRGGWGQQLRVQITAEEILPECPWTGWSACSKTCGGGTQTRGRQTSSGCRVTGSSQQSQACNTNPCPQNCEVGPWGPWSDCSKACGGGSQVSERAVTKPAAHGGAACPELRREQACNTQSCPVDCVPGEWGEWSQCSKECGTGESRRSRPVTTEAQFGGKPCEALEETIECNTQPCAIDCVPGEWGEWSECSKECGTGESRRTRPVATEAQFGGKPCEDLEETIECNTQPCPVDCVVGEWGPWSDCSAQCAGGKMMRERSVTVAAQHGGGECPVLLEEQECNTQPCAVDCELGDWGEWSPCTSECGGGTRQRVRQVVVQPQHNGASCVNPPQHEVCNTQPCEDPRFDRLQQRVRALELARRVDVLERRMLAEGYELTAE